MQVSLSAMTVIDLKAAKKYIQYTANAGFQKIMLDLGLFCSGHALENYGKNTGAVEQEELSICLKRFLEQCGEKTFRIDTMRTPHLAWNTKRTDLNDLMFRIAKESIQCCEVAGSRNLIVQPLFSGIDKESVWQENYSYLLELGHLAQQSRICLLLENQCRNLNGHFVRGVCSDVDEVAQWIDALNEALGDEVFGFCLDTAACNLCGQDMGEMVVILEKRLRSVLVRECDGLYESSRLAFTGMNSHGCGMDWAGLICGLRRMEFDGELIVDAHDTLRGFSPLLREQIYPLMKSVADYFVWQIEIERKIKKYSAWILFGAGQMCRNYMACYGRKYPPAFTCDNDAGLWGSFVCGLEVKSPKVLRQIPQDCVVIICNTYYKEIAKQLRDMGVVNIETFNDEYLPRR
jgi:sugar phosphate isomerase/epimerase